MPLHLSPLTRRNFLRTTFAAGASVLTLRGTRALAGSADPHRFALLSDPHISADVTKVAREINMADHLRAAVAEVAALKTAPAGVFVNGDCAFDHGLPEDYATYSSLLKPLSEAQLPIHMTLGNHDNREVFWESLQGAKGSSQPVASKHVSVIETARANWFLLDSLVVTKQTPGQLGDEQRAWLGKALDAHSQKPALIMLHHNLVPGANGGKNDGLLDTDELLSLVSAKRHVKAIVFGHTHTYRIAEQDGIHLINVPAVGYPFGKTEVTGWVDANLRENGMSLEMRATDPQHPQHGRVTQLVWRA
jgi:3',5'-cyclic AMP phosphodiesterase CpdA